MPIRFTEEQSGALKRIAAACKVGEADVARWAVEALSDYFNHHEGRLMLPLKFTETFRVTKLPDPETMILELPAEPESISGAGAGRIGKRAHKATHRD